MEIGKKQRDPKKSLSRQVVDSIEEMIMELQALVPEMYCPRKFKFPKNCRSARAV